MLVKYTIYTPLHINRIRLSARTSDAKFGAYLKKYEGPIKDGYMRIHVLEMDFPDKNAKHKFNKFLSKFVHSFYGYEYEELNYPIALQTGDYPW